MTPLRLVRCVVIAGAAILCASAVLAATTYTYDDLGRVTKIVFDNGTKIVYCYDAAGNRTTKTVTSGSAPMC